MDVHFENKEGGFFLKRSGASRLEKLHQQLQPKVDADIDLDGTSAFVNGGDSTVLSVDRFTVFAHTHPISVRAAYGPFSTKQTVPARYVVPDPPPPAAVAQFSSSNFVSVLVNSSTSAKGGIFEGDLLLAQGRRDLEVSAHLVNREVARDSPVLRVLFHVSGGSVDRALRKYGRRRSVCVILHVSYATQPPLTAACQPSFDEGQCLAEITIPFSWWPPMPGLDRVNKHQKTPHKSVLVSYYVLEPKNDPLIDEDDEPKEKENGRVENAEEEDEEEEVEEEDDDDQYDDSRRRQIAASSTLEYCSPHLQIQPLTKIDTVPLVNARYGFRELKVDDLLFVLVPMAPVYFRSKVYVPVYARYPPATTFSDNRVVAFHIK